jgi:D-alanyl-D-alanine carboxypeptidase
MAVNIHDYSKTSAQKGWGAGWPSCSGAKGDLATVTTASDARFAMRKRVARLVDILIDECERRGYRFDRPQCGSFNCRPIGGTNRPSNHSWGVAVDINWQRNPMSRPLRTDMPSWMPKLWNRYGFAWGGNYSGTPDTMHYEFMGTPADADEMTELAVREILHKQPPAAPKPRLVIGDDDVAQNEMPYKWVQIKRADGTVEEVKDFDRHPDGTKKLCEGGEICETGSVSLVVTEAWVSLMLVGKGPAKVKVAISGGQHGQDEQPETPTWYPPHGAEYTLPPATRKFFKVPDGASKFLFSCDMGLDDKLISRTMFKAK